MLNCCRNVIMLCNIFTHELDLNFLDVKKVSNTGGLKKVGVNEAAEDIRKNIRTKIVSLTL